MKWLKAATDAVTQVMNIDHEMHEDKRVPNSLKEITTPEPVSNPGVTTMNDRHESDAASENLRKTFGEPNLDYPVIKSVDTCAEEHPANG